MFSIAQNYYDDGYKFPQIVDANKLDNPNTVEVGQVLMIPKDSAQAATNPSATPSASTSPAESPTSNEQTNMTQPVSGGTGGAINQTEWGERITGDTYTVQAGDWLSKISGRAYGDVMMFEKIAKANNIPDPNLIEPGIVLKIPR